MELTKRERRRLKLENRNQEIQPTHREHELKTEHQQIQQINEHPKSSKSKYYAIAVVVGIVILTTVVYSVYSLSKPNPYDSFSKCLTEKGAVMYGAMDWCKFTQAQKAMFGNSFKYIDYHEFNQLEGIKKTPTWVINGAWHENVQSFEKLAALTGCKL